MTDASVANLVPPIPRPVTRRAALRAWAERPVQMWWKSAMLVAIVMTGVTIGQVRDYLRKKDLVETGVPVVVQVVELNDRKIGTGSYHPRRDVELFVRLVGPFPDGRQFEYKGMLPKAEGFAELGGEMDIRVDPDDHSNWAEVGKLPTLSQQFMAVFLLLPVVLILLAIAQWQRMKVLNVWRSGKLRDAIVVDCRHSSIAPRSRVCRYTLPDGDDRRVFQMLVPTRHGVPQRGDVLPMIVNPEQPSRAVVAEFYLHEPVP